MPRTIAADCAARVVVRSRGVVHDREVDGVRVARRRAPDRLVGAPREARDDRRRARDLRAARSGAPARPGSRRSTREVATRARRPRSGSRLPRRSSRGSRDASRCSTRRSSSAFRQGLHSPPRGAHAVRDAAGAAPVQADHVEARRPRRPVPGPRAAARPASSASERPRAPRRARRARRRRWREEPSSGGQASLEPGSAARAEHPSQIQSLPTVRALLAALGVMLVLASGAAAGTAKPRVLAIRFGPDLEVNPVTQDYLTNQLSRAAKDGYDAAVILLDTPGGLSTSMKTIYTAELNAKLPVIVYVSPDGARAASAGVWISAGRRRARDGADDEHRLVDADRLERPEPRLRPAAQGDQRRGRVADRARRRASPQHDVAGARRAQGVEPHRRTGAAHARDRPRRAEPARAARQARRLPDEGRRASVRPAPRGRADRLREAGLLHAAAELADRPEHHQPALPRRHRRPRLRDLPSRHRPARRARRGLVAHCALRVLRAADLVGRPRPDPARRRAARDRRARRQPRRAHRVRPDQPRRRDADAVPQCPCALPHVVCRS